MNVEDLESTVETIVEKKQSHKEDENSLIFLIGVVSGVTMCYTGVVGFLVGLLVGKYGPNPIVQIQKRWFQYSSQKPKKI